MIVRVNSCWVAPALRYFRVPVRCRERLGGLLKYYERKAA